MEEVHFVAADVKVPKYYVKCNKDKAIPADIQQEMAQDSDCRIIEIESDHSPFLHLDTTQDVAAIIAAVAESPHGVSKI